MAKEIEFIEDDDENETRPPRVRLSLDGTTVYATMENDQQYPLVDFQNDGTLFLYHLEDKAKCVFEASRDGTIKIDKS